MKYFGSHLNNSQKYPKMDLSLVKFSRVGEGWGQLSPCPPEFKTMLKYWPEKVDLPPVVYPSPFLKFCTQFYQTEYMVIVNG